MATITVAQDGSGWFSKPAKSIGEALKRAVAGDVIKVEGGEYAENIVINKPVTIIGVDPTAAVVVGTIEVASVSVALRTIGIRNAPGVAIWVAGKGLEPEIIGVHIEKPA